MATAERREPRVVAELLGGVGPSELTRLSLREEIACAHDLLMRLPKRAYLNYDASLAQALSACIADLEDAAEVLEKAQRALRGVASTMSAAKDDFDAAYAKLLRAVKAQLSASVLRSHFPSFAAAEDPPDAFARSAVRHG